MNASTAVLALSCAVLSQMASPACAASGAWTRDQTSAALQRTGDSVAVRFEPRRGDGPEAADAVITRVHAALAYAGTARVSTQLCWGSVRGPCVGLHAAQMDTHALDGHTARGPLWLVYRVAGWGVDHPPLFIRGTVTVWYSDPGH